MSLDFKLGEILVNILCLLCVDGRVSITFVIVEPEN